MATFRATAANDGELIASLGELAKDIREKVGESLKSIRDTKALERVTTASLPALKKYVEGMYVIEALSDRDRGLAMLYEAVAIDSTFAMAWRRIAASYAGQGSGRAAQMAAIEKAYRYRDRLSDNERLTTEAGYHSYGPEPDFDRTIAAYEALLERDSLSSPALNNGGLRHMFKGDYARAEQLLRKAIAIPEPFGGSFGNLIQANWARRSWRRRNPQPRSSGSRYPRVPGIGPAMSISPHSARTMTLSSGSRVPSSPIRRR